MEEALRAALFPQRVSLVLIGAFAAIALTLAAIGVYGVIAHGVAARTQEIGIRMALGADAGTVVRLVVRQALALVAVGLVLGFALALAAGRALTNLLVDVTPRDPATLAAVAVLLTLVGLAAAYLPARRAARVDPGTALRYEEPGAPLITEGSEETAKSKTRRNGVNGDLTELLKKSLRYVPAIRVSPC